MEAAIQEGNERLLLLMKSAPRLLLLEDDPTDALMLRRGLSAQRFDCELIRTHDKQSFVKALNEGGFDLILSDYFIPGFDGLSALAMARERYPEIPFIFVSGAIGDEIAVESLRAGATDYVLKDRPARLVPAISKQPRRHPTQPVTRWAKRVLKQVLKNSCAVRMVLVWLKLIPMAKAKVLFFKLMPQVAVI